MKVTIVTVNNPMCANDYEFDYSKAEFMEKFDSEVSNVGYFADETTRGITIMINPKNCSFIEVRESERE